MRNMRTSSVTPPTCQTRFTESLIRENGLDAHGLKAWIFHPGMLFRSCGKWWGDDGPRKTVHEGLDLLLFTDHEKRIAHLGEATRVPVIFDGVVVSIIRDLLGRTVIVEHLFGDREPGRFCTIYGHIRPHDDIRGGSVVTQGDVIGTLAGTGTHPFPMAPHLHLSAGWISGAISYDRLNWDSIGDSGALTLLDPLHLLDWPYRILADAGPKGLDF